MSTQSIQSNIEHTQRDIESLNRKLSQEYKNESQKTENISRANQSIVSSKSASTIQSKMREIERLQRDVVQIQKKKADLTKQISDKTARLHTYQKDLMREQTREQKKFMDNLKRQQEDARRQQDRIVQEIRLASHPLHSGGATSSSADVEYDAFISHATEDKEDVARPLAERLASSGCSIWYDNFQLKVGDSLRHAIDKGLANLRFGIVVLSPSFFAKNWPEYELNGLVSKEMSQSGKVILPLWHKVSRDEVMKYSPTLADKVALKTADSTIDEIANQLLDALRGDSANSGG